MQCEQYQPLSYLWSLLLWNLNIIIRACTHFPLLTFQRPPTQRGSRRAQTRWLSCILCSCPAVSGGSQGRSPSSSEWLGRSCSCLAAGSPGCDRTAPEWQWWLTLTHLHGPPAAHRTTDEVREAKRRGKRWEAASKLEVWTYRRECFPTNLWLVFLPQWWHQPLNSLVFNRDLTHEKVDGFSEA